MPLPDDGQANAEAALASRDVALALNEHVERLRKERRCDADARIAHIDLDDGSIDAREDLDAAIIRGVLSRVRQQASQHLTETIAIDEQVRWHLNL